MVDDSSLVLGYEIVYDDNYVDNLFIMTWSNFKGVYFS